MWQILSGQEREARYQSALSRADREAIVEILRDTKSGSAAVLRDRQKVTRSSDDRCALHVGRWTSGGSEEERLVTALNCPICGIANDCGIALGKGTCWCFSTTIPPDVLARVPVEQRERVCICRACAESTAPVRTGPAPE